MSELRLTGRTAIVTGGGAGIGRAISVELARLGSVVVVADRDGDAGVQVVEEIRALGLEALDLQTDVSDLESVSRLVSGVENRVGRADILVNNAGVSRSSELLDVSVEEWDEILDVNAKGLFFLMQKIAERMWDQGDGRIVNIASIAGKGWGGSSSAAYAASKGAVLALTRYASRALAAQDITVNAVCPGITMTPILERLLRERADAAGRSYDDYLEEYFRQVPLGRINTPADIAYAVAFFASPLARNITGQSLNVDGGLVFD